MSPLDNSLAILMISGAEFDRWLEKNGTTEREIIVALFKKGSGRQTVTLAALQEAALCHGWVDSHGQRIDDERWAIRFAPRRPGSNWSATNRERARRLLKEGKVQPAGLAVLPEDL
jgi:uncharacterized protein YdeI (YjbR/CyaY-like superfamily)